MKKFDNMFDKYLEEMSTDPKESKNKLKELRTSAKDVDDFIKKALAAKLIVTNASGRRLWHNIKPEKMEEAKIDHTEYPKRLKKKSDDALRFIIKDADEAMKVNPDSEKSKNGYYADEINYAAMELKRRENKKG